MWRVALRCRSLGGGIPQPPPLRSHRPRGSVHHTHPPTTAIVTAWLLAQVAKIVVPLLSAAHSTCSPRGCKASEYDVQVDDGEGRPPPPPPPPPDAFSAITGGFV